MLFALHGKNSSAGIAAWGEKRSPCSKSLSHRAVPQTWHHCHSIKTPACIFVHSTPINVSHRWTRLITCLVAIGPQLAAFYLFTCSISRPASPRRSAPSQRCPRSKPQRRRGKSPRLFTEAQLLNGCMCISAGEESNRCVPTPGAWSSSCRLITARHKLQNSPDLLGCLKGSPKLSLFFPNPNSLCLLSLPAHACLKATHPVKNTYWFFFFLNHNYRLFTRVTLQITFIHTWMFLRQSFKAMT